MAVQLDPVLLEVLACPDTHHAPLSVGTPDDPDADALTCTECGRVFEVRDGIPVLLLAEDAESTEDADSTDDADSTEDADSADDADGTEDAESTEGATGASADAAEPTGDAADPSAGTPASGSRS